MFNFIDILFIELAKYFDMLQKPLGLYCLASPQSNTPGKVKVVDNREAAGWRGSMQYFWTAK